MSNLTFLFDSPVLSDDGATLRRIERWIYTSKGVDRGWYCSRSISYIVANHIMTKTVEILV
ncbi:hypothetical protein AT251_23540 [Enterovibrio nigricans]|nr:hypothetical protein AT251_23540 [Enterovibrio nigricans]